MYRKAPGSDVICLRQEGRATLFRSVLSGKTRPLLHDFHDLRAIAQLEYRNATTYRRLLAC
jgi:hypothetical protein